MLETMKKKITGEGCLCIITMVGWIKDGFVKEMKFFAKETQASDWMCFKMKAKYPECFKGMVAPTKNGFV